jgi:hypothetical protein
MRLLRQITGMTPFALRAPTRSQSSPSSISIVSVCSERLTVEILFGHRPGLCESAERCRLLPDLHPQGGGDENCHWQLGGANLPGTSNSFGGNSAAEYGPLLTLAYPTPGTAVTHIGTKSVVTGH